MSNINQTFNDRVRYTLKSKNLDPLIITEPIGWENDEKEFTRNENHHGIIAKFSNSLKFIGSGADYIQYILELYGINEEIKLIREEKHPHTDIWTLTYSGYLDLSTWTKEKNQVSVKFNSGGLEQLLKSRESEKIEIDRLTTIDGKSIPSLNTIDVELEGRRIFLKTKYEKETATGTVTLDVQSDAGNTRRGTTGYPLKLVNKSHENAQNVLSYSSGNDTIGSTGMMFFANSDRDRELIIKGDNIRFKPVVTAWDFDWAIISVCLTVFENGIDYNVKSREYLFTSQNLPGDSSDQINLTHNLLRELNFTRTINLLKNESIALELFIEADLQGGGSQHFRVDFTEMNGNLFIDEDSFHEKTSTKAILAHEIADRLVTIGTNTEQAFYSDFLGRTDIGYDIDGKGSLTAFTHGFWVRGFDKLPIPTEATATTPAVDNLFKPLTTSFKEYVESMSAVWNIGIGIETLGDNEIVRLEELSYFYNRNVTIKLPNQVKNVKRTIATNKYYSSIEIGYEEGGDYEEACGLDECNVKSTFTTVINRLKNTYSKLSNYRADSYGMEFARRKQKSLNDTEDTPYDDKIFFLDLKKGITNVFIQRKWQDDFENAPTGIFSPDTATNLRFSPFNMLLRHGWAIAAGLVKYPTDYIRYGSSTANSQLRTKLIGGNEVAENGNIINSELQAARFLAEEIEFEHVCDFDVMQQVNGSTSILGKKTPNFYGLVEFINENNETEKGFLFNLKPNGKGNWKVLKSKR